MFEFTAEHKDQVQRQLLDREPSELKNEHLFALINDKWCLVAVGNEELVHSGIIEGAEAYLHTHGMPSNTPVIPSKHDMNVMASSNKPIGIMNYCRHEDVVKPVFWHESIKATADTLEQRRYRWGDYGSDGKGDCFAVIADWHRLNTGYEFPTIPRDFYDSNGYYYTENFHEHTRIKKADEPLVPGDILVVRVGRQGEHAGVYVGNGVMLHHPINGVSRYTPIHATMNRLHMRLGVLTDED